MATITNITERLDAMAASMDDTATCTQCGIRFPERYVLGGTCGDCHKNSEQRAQAYREATESREVLENEECIRINIASLRRMLTDLEAELNNGTDCNARRIAHTGQDIARVSDRLHMWTNRQNYR